MAKKRRNIHDIQKALLEQTQQLSVEPENVEPERPAPIDRGDTITIPQRAIRKLRILARYQKTTPEALVELAIEDFLALRNRQLEEAIRQISGEEE